MVVAAMEGEGRSSGLDNLLEGLTSVLATWWACGDEDGMAVEEVGVVLVAWG